MLELKTYHDQIQELGDYFVDVLPSEVTSSRIMEAEDTLNTMYKMALHGSYTSEIQSAISAAIGDAGNMSYVVKNNDDNPPSTFFSTVKDLGGKLLLLTNLLENLEDETDDR